MMAGLAVFLCAGHVWLIGLVVAIQVLAFKEVINLVMDPSIEVSLPWGRSLSWYFLATTIYYLEGESVIHYFKNFVLIDNYLLPLAVHHRFFAYCLYIIGFIFFVYSLEMNHYRFQFKQFCITHMALFLVVVQGNFIVNNIFNGIFWFFVPASLVITNDIFAYLCGITFGVTPLIKISPKKTVEGFLGAWICTVISGIVLVKFLSTFPYFICPISNNIGLHMWSDIQCTPNPVFIPYPHLVPSVLQPYLNRTTVTFADIYLHVSVLSTFASLIAPFGGFFASGLKRTFQVKDFGDTIPGHGGIVDRFDCQFVMAFFAYLYYDTFVAAAQAMDVEKVLESAILGLSSKDQVALTTSLLKYLVNNGIVADTIMECLPISQFKR